MYESTDLIQILKFRALNQPNKVAYTFLNELNSKDIITYKELEEKVRNIASILINTDAANNRVLIMYPPGIEYIAIFLGCLYANYIAIPCYPSYKVEADERLSSMIKDAKPGIAIRKSKNTIEKENLKNLYGNIIWLDIEYELDRRKETNTHVTIDPGSIAFLQYTSGSTTLPKGVMVSHKNLVHNLQRIKNSFELTEQSSVVLWLPPYHDMGLIGGILEALYTGYTVYLITPVSFIRKPYLWLETITKYKADVSGAPNFAYDLCVDRISEEKKDFLDLSSWTLAFSGAEPIREATLKRFYEAFKRCGFLYNSFYGCYGLAEATLMVSGGHRQIGPTIKSFDKEDLKENKIVTTCDPQASMICVGSGSIVDDIQVSIIDPETKKQCEQDVIGEIWVKGDSVANGYWNKSKEENEIFNSYISHIEDGPYLRTGDLGVIHNGELFVMGRKKDLIILRGKNYYPQDIEIVTEVSHPLLSINSGVAFSVEEEGEEQLVIVYEIERSQRNAEVDINEISVAVRQAVFKEFNIQVYDFVLVMPKQVLKTSSGKVRRKSVKEKYLKQELKAIGHNKIESKSAVEKAKSLDSQKSSFVLTALQVMNHEESRKDLLHTYLQQTILNMLPSYKGIMDLNQELGSLGMDSIKIIVLGHKIEEELNVTIPFERLYEDSSILELSDYILERLRTDNDKMDVSEIREESYPFSKGQKALWFLYNLDRENVAYNISSAVLLESMVENGILQEAYSQLKVQHPILNSVFINTENVPIQKIDPKLKNELVFVNGESWSEEMLDVFLEKEINTPFDLLKAPYIRVQIVKRKDEKSIILFVVHHIISDFWSLSLLLKDFVTNVKKIMNHEKINHNLGRDYSDYVHWQNEFIESNKGQEAFLFFGNYLEGCPLKINMPLDFPREDVITFNGNSITKKLEKSVYDRLCNYSKERNTTVFPVLLTAFYTLLYQYTNDKDIVVGVPVAARPKLALARISGYCTNMLPVRVKIDENKSFDQLFLEVRSNIAKVFSYQEYPFSAIVEKLQINRDISYSPVYQIAFVYQQSTLFDNRDFSAFALGLNDYQIEVEGMCMQSVSLNQKGSQFDFTLMLADTSDGLELSLRYNSDLYKEETAVHILNAYHYILLRIFDNSEILIKQIDIIPEEEVKRIVYGFNKTFKVYDDIMSYPFIFTKVAKKSGKKIAIVYRNQVLDYQALEQKSTDFARYLMSMGVGRNMLIGVYMDRSPELFIGILGILKAGGAYVPIDITYPNDRIEYMMEDSETSIIVTKKSLADRIHLKNKVNLIFMESVEEENFEASPIIEPELDDICYMIYTSGSTGKPKGVVIKHKSLTNFVHSISDEIQLTENDVVVSMTTVSFDMFVFDSLLPLVKGLTLVLPDEDENKDTEALISLMEKNNVTVVQTTPSKYKMLTKNRNDLSFLKNLRVVVAGGEPFSRQLLELFSKNSDCEIYNAYGPTEATVYAISCKLCRDELITIGRPIQNTYIYILNSELKPVPIGVIGELYISGICLAKGYYKKEELTKEKFLDCPFALGYKMYRTGDQARWLSDGRIEYCGRIDNQVKIRGYRIEIDEIEKQILNYDGIKEVAVVDKEDADGNKYLCAYLVASEIIFVNELSRFLSDWLPHYMIPSYFIQVGEMTSTPNGKTDRNQLKKLSHALYIQDSYTESENETEERLKKIWKNIFSVEKLSTTSNFFLSGGDSLMATTLVNLIQKEFHVQLPLSDIFKYNTIKEQSSRIESFEMCRQLPIEPSKTPAVTNGIYKASEVQKRVYLATNMDNSRLSYNMPGVITITGGNINSKKLEDGLIQLINRHEILRTSFRLNEDEVVQCIQEHVLFELEIKEVDTIDMKKLADEFIRPFSLEKSPLIRARLVYTQNLQLLFIDVHHIVMDGISLNKVIQELTKLYNGDSLTDITMQYKDYSQWQIKLLETEYMKEKETFWLDQFKTELPPLALPYDYTTESDFSYEGDCYEFTIGQMLMEQLYELSNRTGTTLYMVFLSAYYTLLSFLSKQTDIVIATLGAGRNHACFENTVGMFVNTILLRIRTDGNINFEELLQKIKDISMSAFENQEYPFEQLISKLGQYEQRATNPLIDVMFIFQNEHRGVFKIGDMEYKVEELRNNISKFNLTLEVQPEKDNIRCKLEFRTDLFIKETIVTFGDYYQNILKKIVCNSKLLMKDLIVPSAKIRVKQTELQMEQINEKTRELPKNETEETLLAIWQRVLKVDIIGTETKFFMLGGDSLKAYRVINEIQKQMNINVPYKEFFKHPTIKQMCNFIREQYSDNVVEAIKEEIAIQELNTCIEQREQYEPFSLTEVQEAYWFGRRKGYELGNIASHVYIEIDQDNLIPAKFQNGIRKLIERHPMLRAVILSESTQQIKPFEEVREYQPKFIDITDYKEEEQLNFLEQTRNELSHQILDSSKWPLFDIRLTKWGEKVRIHFSMDLLIVDALSIQMLMQELSVYYSNPDEELPVINYTFREYMKHSVKKKQTDGYKKSLAYWKEKVPTIYPAPELPMIKTADKVKKPYFCRRSGKIDKDTWELLKDRAAIQQVTPTVVLAAAYVAVLALWSKNRQMTINMTKFNRPMLNNEINSVVGDFTSLILLSADVTGDASFTEFIKSLQDQQMENMDHSEVDAVEIMREYAFYHNLFGKALMPVVFTSIMGSILEEREYNEANEQGYFENIIYSVTQTPQVILDSQVTERFDGIVVNWDAVEELFPEKLLDDMFEAYLNLIDKLALKDDIWEHSVQNIVDLPAHQLSRIEKVCDTKKVLEGGLLFESFLEYVKNNPDEIAVISTKGKMAYKEVYLEAVKIRNEVSKYIEKPDTLIAVMLRKDWEQIVTVLGIVISGGAYLPIDPSLPEERINLILQNSKVNIIITKQEFEKKLDKIEEELNILYMESEGNKLLLEQPVEEVFDFAFTPSDTHLSYVIYTSGSTGVPKGVMIEHRGAVNTIQDVNERFGIHGQDRILQISALNFDLSVYDIFGLLSKGGSVVIPDESRLLDPSYWHDMIKKHSITIWNTVPAYMEMYEEYLAAKSLQLPESLRLVLLSGDKIPSTLPKKLYDKSKIVEVVSLGGATEASIWSILHPIDRSYNDTLGIPYGKSMYNQICYVMDKDANILPIWAVGEIYIGGIGVARGYCNGPEKTEERFIMNSQLGERLYKTGDLGRYNMMGEIEFLGREDKQVKIRGHRIELGEIEAILDNCQGIQKSAVVVTGERSEEQQIAAYYITNSKREEKTDIIKNLIDRFKFKLQHINIRKEEKEENIKLYSSGNMDFSYFSRRSYRRFKQQSVSFYNFSGFLQSIQSISLDQYPFPKYRYASAGSLYPVQTYVYVKKDGIEGITQGIYYYNPLVHELSRVSSEPNRITPEHYSSTNGEIFKTASFSIFFIAQMDAIYPLYGEWSRDFCLIESGLISQLLDMDAVKHQIGLCQIGDFDFKKVRNLFNLSDSQSYLYSLIGGVIEPEDITKEKFIADNSNTVELMKEIQNSAQTNEVVDDNKENFARYQENNNQFSNQDIMDYARKHLPEYMVPKILMPLEEFPLSANGKIDYKQLPKIKKDSGQISKRSNTKSETELRILKIWKEVLKLSQINAEENLFDIGGTSVQLIRIHSKLCEEFSLELPIVEMFAHTNIRALGSYIKTLLIASQGRNEVFFVERKTTENRIEIKESQINRYKHNRKKRGLDNV